MKTILPVERPATRNSFARQHCISHVALGTNSQAKICERVFGDRGFLRYCKKEHKNPIWE